MYLPVNVDVRDFAFFCFSLSWRFCLVLPGWTRSGPYGLQSTCWPTYHCAYFLTSVRHLFQPFWLFAHRSYFLPFFCGTDMRLSPRRFLFLTRAVCFVQRESPGGRGLLIRQRAEEGITDSQLSSASRRVSCKVMTTFTMCFVFFA